MIRMIIGSIRVLILLGFIHLLMPDLSFTTGFLLGDFLGKALFGGF